jgi:type I restriction enzyme M protein
MLDKVTKKKIDDLRQIIVGKVSDPRSQVEQITNGLLYKFISDMDEKSISQGGVASFFINSYEKYKWKKIIDNQISGEEKVKLYSDALEKFYFNDNLPELFREIFKNSSLPYKDPSVFNKFIKLINEFEYKNSENLGDAFEYLLSFMGKQGEAGQFRTPRHIIDFIVEIINPKKEESILDPASGTAGFLISAYKKILHSNTKKNSGDLLSSEDLTKLTTNLVGYDISPEFLKVSLMNMYLHNITKPKIFEYDTLSSEIKWNEYFDVILANPPFFSPKGGITPHNRFSVKSKKAEILFIDYIVEHLKPSGRAGVIVPEGIIFDGEKGYCQIRKKLVENSLIGVISLPKGVFQPYSPVKTNILIIDKKLKKIKKDIFFIKINNDGFSLGAQRKSVSLNDLPAVLKNLNDYFNNKNFKKDLIKFVSKETILKREDTSLVYEKYVKINYGKTNFDTKKFKLKELATIISGSRDKGGAKDKGIPSIGGKQISTDGTITNEKMVYISKEHFKSMKKGILQKGDVLIVKDGATTGKIGFYDGQYENAAVNEHVFILRCNKLILKKYLYYFLQTEKFKKKMQPYNQGIIGGINLEFGEIDLEIPRIEKQKEILDEITSIHLNVDNFKKLSNDYQPLVDYEKDTKFYSISEICEINPSKKDLKELNETTDVSFIPMEDMDTNNTFVIPKKIKKLKDVIKGYSYFKDNDILLAKITPCFENGKCSIVNNLKNNIGFGSTEFYVLRCDEKKVLTKWLYTFLISNKFRNLGVKNFTGTSGHRRVPNEFLSNYKIPVPSIEFQKKEVEKIEKELQVLNELKVIFENYNRKLINMINKI